jgi:putative membrane protein
MEFAVLVIKTILLRPYVFLFLAGSLFVAHRLLGWKRTAWFFGVTWITAFACEFSSTRTGIPFGWYHYTGSTVGHELYLSNIPFIDSLSFTFLLFASYCLALLLLLPSRHVPLVLGLPAGRLPGGLHIGFTRDMRTSWSVLVLSVLFFVFIDMITDPVALRGDRWFLGRLYYYPAPGIHFGVPIANYVGWGVVGLISLTTYFILDRRLPELSRDETVSVTRDLLLGCALYYSVLIFNLAISFWIGERLIGATGLLSYIPITALVVLRILGGYPIVGRVPETRTVIVPFASRPSDVTARPHAPSRMADAGTLARSHTDTSDKPRVGDA